MLYIHGDNLSVILLICVEDSLMYSHGGHCSPDSSSVRMTLTECSKEKNTERRKVMSASTYDSSRMEFSTHSRASYKIPNVFLRPVSGLENRQVGPLTFLVGEFIFQARTYGILTNLLVTFSGCHGSCLPSDHDIALYRLFGNDLESMVLRLSIRQQSRTAL